MAEPQWWKRVQQAAQDVRSGRWLDDARVTAGRVAAETQASAERFARIFSEARAAQASPEALARSLDEALGTIEQSLDRHCNALMLGLARRAGAGLAHLEGRLLIYVRPEGPIRAQLRDSDFTGRVAALSLGAGAGGFAACLYGPRATLVEPLKVRGADAGLLMASVGLFQARCTQRPEKATGWMMGVGAGVGLGIPLVSDISGFGWEEHPRSIVALPTASSRPIEARLAEAPDRRVLRGAARAL